MANHIRITFEHGEVEDHITDLTFMEFVGVYNNTDKESIINEMFEQRFVFDHVTDTRVVWYHDGKTLCQKTNRGTRRYDFVNF